MADLYHLADSCERGIELADDLMVRAGLGEIVKARQLDPLNARDFVTLVERFSRVLYRLEDATYTPTAQQALQVLDVNWGALTTVQREEAFRAADVAMHAMGRGMLPRFEREFEARATRAVEGTRKASRRTFKLEIEPELSRTDERIAEFVKRSNLLFVTDQFGERAAAFTAKAREIVTAGMDEGASRDVISKDLKRALGPEATVGKRRGYWTVVAAAFMGRARAGTLLSAFNEAGITSYRFFAVMDERTTQFCRLLHDTVWRTQDGLDSLENAMRQTEPDDIKAAVPWVQEGKDDEGNAIMYIKNRDGSRTVVADVVRPSYEKDKVGEYRQRMSNGEMSAAGIIWPPCHGRCRSTILVT